MHWHGFSFTGKFSSLKAIASVKGTLHFVMAPKRNSKRSAGETMDTTLDLTAVKKLKSALAYRSGDPVIDEVARQYAQGTREKKQEIIDQFAADSKMKWASSFVSLTSHTDGFSSKDKFPWLTKLQIAKAEGWDVNEPEQDRLLEMLLTDLESKKHWSPRLAAEGILLYEYRKSSTATESNQTVKRETMDTLIPDKSKAAPKRAAAKSASQPGVTIAVSWQAACQKQRSLITTLCSRADTYFLQLRDDMRKGALKEESEGEIKAAITNMEAGMQDAEELLKKTDTEETHKEMVEGVKLLSEILMAGQVSCNEVWKKEEIRQKRKPVLFTVESLKSKKELKQEKQEKQEKEQAGLDSDKGNEAKEAKQAAPTSPKKSTKENDDAKA